MVCACAATVLVGQDGILRRVGNPPASLLCGGRLRPIANRPQDAILPHIRPAASTSMSLTVDRSFLQQSCSFRGCVHLHRGYEPLESEKTLWKMGSKLGNCTVEPAGITSRSGSNRLLRCEITAVTGAGAGSFA